jgi:hypothetical protein
MKNRIIELFARIIICYVRICNKYDKKTAIFVINILYQLRIGRKLNLSNPKSYTEKIQKYKFLLKDNGYEKFVDKVEVRKWITEQIGDKYLIPIFGTWDNADNICFEELPDEFVLKTNHGAGMNLVVTDKKSLNKKKIVRIVNKWLKRNYVLENGYEYQYQNVKPKVYAEKLMENSAHSLPEYKFMCFDGEPIYCICDIDRFGNHCRNIYDMSWNLQKWNTGGFENSRSDYSMPACFDEMVAVCKKLAEGFSHVRVDLYVIDNNIYFSELTFTTGSGYSSISPAIMDYKLGDMWNLS